MLESGMELTFVHRLTVVRRRALFFDKVLARRTITVSAEQDTLTKQYTLRRRVGDQPEETIVRPFQGGFTGEGFPLFDFNKTTPLGVSLLD